ncbi:hypothetical protein [Streptomyces goshikiensis]|uniref:hypothetical protein n=1 Tax=Streptomyces goshikiensis TaxID=1942 RepID=UPI00365DE062
MTTGEGTAPGSAVYRGPSAPRAPHRHAAFQVAIAERGEVALADARGTPRRDPALIVPPTWSRAAPSRTGCASAAALTPAAALPVLRPAAPSRGTAPSAFGRVSATPSASWTTRALVQHKAGDHRGRRADAHHPGQFVDHAVAERAPAHAGAPTAR